MPVNDVFDNDQFMKLQIEIIQAVQKVKHTCHHETYQQPTQYASYSSLSPTKSSNYSIYSTTRHLVVLLTTLCSLEAKYGFSAKIQFNQQQLTWT